MPEDPYTYVVAAFQAPSTPDYVPGPEEPEQEQLSPVYVPYVPELDPAGGTVEDMIRTQLRRSLRNILACRRNDGDDER
ncbi:hypothetical protein Tco_0421575 [Tanacetum coccineum]